MSGQSLDTFYCPWLNLKQYFLFLSTGSPASAPDTPERDLEAGWQHQPEAAPPPRGGGMNAIARVFRDQDIGKLIIGFLMPLTTILLSPYAPVSGLVRDLVLLSLSIGFAAIWNGIMLRNVVPERYAIYIEQIGAASVILAVYGVLSSFLPPYLLWISWACYLAILLPSSWIVATNFGTA